MAIDPMTGNEAPLFNPQKDRWPEHFSWSENKTTIVGQTSVGRATIEALKINRPAMIELRRYWLAAGNHPQNFQSEIGHK